MAFRPERDSSGKVTAPGSTDVSDVRVGGCFNTDDDLADYKNPNGAQAALTVRVVPCDQSHKAEVYGVFDLDDRPYPGKEAVFAAAEKKCGGTALTDYVGEAAKLPESLGSSYYTADSNSWDAGDREVTCFVADSGGPSTGSVRVPGS
ncbi:septum formation family protein [Streptomyces sp. NPDC044571]|uniref:septum formation family protein n=1 Tax=Streptomyces sp. NPDC044571 TaxID=3155371 RepID=UPI0033DB069A